MSATGEKYPEVVIIGGGISGLAAAHQLLACKDVRYPAFGVTVLESSTRFGGLIRTNNSAELLVEHGPDCFITQKPAALELCQQLAIESRIIATNPLYRRTLVVRAGKLQPLPDGFALLAPSNIFSFLTSPVFSPLGKVRMLCDLILPGQKNGKEESLASFVRRRFGQESLERVAQPMIGGVYTADPELLSLKATMPRFLELESRFGSVIRGLSKEQSRSEGKQDSGARYSLFASLDQGMELLVEALVTKIGKRNLRLNSKVVALNRLGNRWQMHLDNKQELFADYLILAAQAHQTAAILPVELEAIASALNRIQHASSVVINFLYNQHDFPRLPESFGFVVPVTERKSILALSFSSLKFAHRAPKGQVLLRVFMGGALQPEQLQLEDFQLLKAARADLGDLLQITAAPQAYWISRHHSAMPQYHIGHLSLVESLRSLVLKQPGLFLAGNYLSGVGIPDCIYSGQLAAKQVLDCLLKCRA